MILFVNNNAGILFLVTTVVAEIWREIKRYSSIITKVLNVDSLID